MVEKLPIIAVLGTRGIPDVMGGVEAHCQALYPRLVERGYRVTVFARKGYINADKTYIYHGVKVVPLWAPKKKHLEAIFHTTYGIFKILTVKRNFDILHIHAIGPALLIPLARILGLKVVMTHHGQDYNRKKWGPLAKAMLRMGERFGCHFSHRVITISRYIHKTIDQLYNCDGCYIPNGVLLPEILPPAEALSRWRLIPKKYILTVGRFVPEKGFHDLLQAFTQMNTDWNLVIAGSADHDDVYSQNLKKRAAYDRRVIMTGFIKGRELGEIYSNAGLFVLPSYHEGSPIALLEAMSYGLPVITSDIAANRELTNLSETFPVGNIDALKKRLEDSLISPKIISNRRSQIESEFNWDRIAEQTDKVYQSLFSK